jgi:hypothetical protein
MLWADKMTKSLNYKQAATAEVNHCVSACAAMRKNRLALLVTEIWESAVITRLGISRGAKPAAAIPEI